MSSRRQSGQKHKRKSSSESSGTEPVNFRFEESNAQGCIKCLFVCVERAGPSKKARDLRSPSDLDVVLDAFQEFVRQYKYVYIVILTSRCCF